VLPILGRERRIGREEAARVGCASRRVPVTPRNRWRSGAVGGGSKFLRSSVSRVEDVIHPEGRNRDGDAGVKRLSAVAIHAPVARAPEAGETGHPPPRKGELDRGIVFHPPAGGFSGVWALVARDRPCEREAGPELQWNPCFLQGLADKSEVLQARRARGQKKCRHEES